MKNQSKPGRHLRASDLRALAQLGVDATQALTDVAEGVHQSVWRTLGFPSGASSAQTRGLTGLIYQSIGALTQRLGLGVSTALAALEPLLTQLAGQGDESFQRAGVLAALNGVMGDHLQASANSLATPMTLRYQGQLVEPRQMGSVSGLSSKLALLVHGLCMNDLQWQPAAQTTPSDAGQPRASAASARSQCDYASSLAQTLGYTPLYLRYNSGLHISQNGQQLALLLEELVSHWPLALDDLTVLAHSMGGLVTRSAVQWATEAGLRWPSKLKNMVFLGTPHHGAPLERAGNWVDLLLGATPWSRPFAKLAQLRSAGVTDLRYGLLRDADWQGRDRFGRLGDTRQPLPLPAGVACFTVAATCAAKRSAVADHLLGDGLVPLRSALGQHRQNRHQLQFAPQRVHIAYRTKHLQLLSDPALCAQLLRWLA